MLILKLLTINHRKLVSIICNNINNDILIFKKSLVNISYIHTSKKHTFSMLMFWLELSHFKSTLYIWLYMFINFNS